MKTLQQFIDTLPAMRRPRALETLEMQVRYNGGEFLTRRELIERKVTIGAIVTENETFGPVLQSPDGAFFDKRNITAIGLDYARYLQDAR